jgi:hypothetical protein
MSFWRSARFRVRPPNKYNQNYVDCPSYVCHGRRNGDISVSQIRELIIL